MPVVVDINVLVDAALIEPDPSQWESPPWVRGDAAAMTLAILNEGLEFELWLSRHLVDGTMRVLREEFRWSAAGLGSYEAFLAAVVSRAGGMAEPTVTVADCDDWEDNRVLELAETVGAFLIISSADDLLRMSPWHGIPIVGPDAFVDRVDAARRHRGRGRVQ